ncbi:MAG: DUF1800 domain-containing protein [Planctomycetes bacterium]|nr:DUF1800 domain-containing protein [Planctomycetota bacterium]
MRRFSLLALTAALLCAYSPDNGPTAQDADPGKTTAAPGLNEDQKLHHFLNRFTLGATPALMAEVKQKGMKAWLEEQLKGARQEPAVLNKALEPLLSLDMTLEQVRDSYVKKLPRDADVRERKEAQRLGKVPERELLESIVLRGTYSNNQVREVSMDFFRNHLCISVDKGPVSLMAGNYEASVLRANALGDFGTLLMASAKHPAMLFYLDNHLSCRPATPEEIELIKRRGRNVPEKIEAAQQRGLNENYARELLELHTLGVDNYYTQDDVIEVAKCLTGWTINPEFKKEGGGFQFARLVHCGGDKKVLGTTIKENRENPLAEGEEVVRMLAAHEGTAKYVSFKLCRWLVNDQPSDALVGRIAAVFREKKGNLPAVLLAIYEDPEFFAAANYQCKYKRPFEFVVSVLRATGAEVTDASGLQRSLLEMNEPLYRCANPTGYYDQAESWQDPGAMSLRWKFALDLAENKINGVKLPEDVRGILRDGEPRTWKDKLAKRLLCVPLSAGTSAALDKLVDRQLADGSKNAMRDLGALLIAGILGSPEFQKQ